MNLINKIESLRYDIENGVETDVINISVRLIQIRDQAKAMQLQQDVIESPTEDLPIEFEPVLAEIEHINDLGKSTWHEVVYYDNTEENWQSYSGSKTFEDGEQVVKWKYVKDCL